MMALKTANPNASAKSNTIGRYDFSIERCSFRLDIHRFGGLVGAHSRSDGVQASYAYPSPRSEVYLSRCEAVPKPRSWCYGWPVHPDQLTAGVSRVSAEMTRSDTSPSLGSYKLASSFR